MATTPAPHTLKKMPVWRNDDEADEWLQNANLNDYDLGPAVPLVEWLERQEEPTLETLHSDLVNMGERLSELSDEVRSLKLAVQETRRSRRVPPVLKRTTQLTKKRRSLPTS